MGLFRAFIAALLVLTGTAWAQEDKVPNLGYSDDIGSLVLLQTPCFESVASMLGDIAPLFKAVIYTHVVMGSMEACWVAPPGSGVVMIAYADGDSSTLPQHLFKPVGEPAKAGKGI